jgi:transposase-like protein
VGNATTNNEFKHNILHVTALFSEDKDGPRNILREVLQEVLEQEMTDLPGAAGKGERSPARLGYRSGYMESSGAKRSRSQSG